MVKKIDLKKQASSSVSNPGTGQLSFFFDPNGVLTSKNEFGVLVAYGTHSDLHSHIDADIAPLKGIANGVASLGSDSKLEYSQSPTVKSYVVASQAAMLALVAKTGEMAMRSDTAQTFILNGADPTVFGNWQLILSPLAPVSSVNDKVGHVVIDKSDIGLSNVTNVDTSTTVNITDSLDKRFVTDAQKSTIATVGFYTNTSSATNINIPANSAPTIVPGMSASPVAGTHNVTFNGQYASAVSSTTAQAASDLTAAYNTLMALPATVTGHAPTFNTETLSPGVYQISGAGSIVGSKTLTLDGQGNSSSLFVFRMTGAFSTGASAVVNLINGANANNVFWVAQGACSIGAANTFRGTVISLAAINIGSGSIIEGRIASAGGALSGTASTVYKPSGTSQISMGTFDSFAMFTSSGGVTNTGVSTIAGNIGTNLGAISGFESSTVNGNFYTQAFTSSVLTFGLYNNGTLVPNSSRSAVASAATSAATAILDAVVTTVTNDVLDVRVKIDSGTMTTGNRNFTTVRIG